MSEEQKKRELLKELAQSGARINLCEHVKYLLSERTLTDVVAACWECEKTNFYEVKNVESNLTSSYLKHPKAVNVEDEIINNVNQRAFYIGETACGFAIWNFFPGNKYMRFSSTKFR